MLHSMVKFLTQNFIKEKDDIHGKNLIKLIKECSKRNIKITGISINNVCSFSQSKYIYKISSLY